VEIHFYLLWPLLLLGFRNRLFSLCLGGICVISALRVLSIKSGFWTPELGYHASHLRFDSLLWGALVFAVHRTYRDNERLQRWLPRLLIPFAMIAATFLVFGTTRSSESGNLLGFPAVDISFAIFLLLVLRQKQGLISAVLLLPFVRLAGRLSYAIYVFHFPLLLLCRELLFHGDFPEWHGMVWPAALLTGALAIPLTFLVAWLSWHLLEKPCMALKRRFA
jgi:peptidoglycan/LPS O-acetylase OafA/YrhL